LGSGRRVSLDDRREVIELIGDAHKAGARRSKCCEMLEINLRTLERWEKFPHLEDGRQGPSSSPNALTEEEKMEIINVSTSEKYKDMSPSQIVPHLSDEGRYIASESSFYRVLKAHNMLNHRRNSHPPTTRTVDELITKKPNELWSWDITYLKTSIKGKFFYLYLPLDLFSRKIVYFEVHESENSDLSSAMIEKACLENNIQRNQIILHSDNGGPMKGATMLATLQSLGIVPSFSRPSVSNDNPFSESIFKTLKYSPQYPKKGFESLEEARLWVKKFVYWYNNIHLHSGINFVTPQSRHEGKDKEILTRRKEVYEKARNENPARWSRGIKNFNQVNIVYLNPKKLKRRIRLIRQLKILGDIYLESYRSRSLVWGKLF
jgi:putative transposase